MPYVTHQPSEPLAGFVEYLWWLSDEPAHAQERIVPSGTQELVINLHADEFEIRAAGAGTQRFSGAMVSGAYGRYFVVDTRAHVSLLGVHFKPGGAGAMLGVPPGELADQHVDLGELWGPASRELCDRLRDAATAPLRFQILELELLTRLARSLRSQSTHPAVAVALRRLAREPCRVAAVARELGFTGRRFIQLFTAEVGMTPKLFARVQRFQSALTRARTTSVEWSELALQAGYCDQSHLIRDFVSFSGFPPAELLRHARPGMKEHHLAHSGKIRPRRP